MLWTETFSNMFLFWIFIFIFIAVYILLIRRLYRLLKVKNARNHTIELTNQGNLSSIYQFSVTSKEPQLDFTLLSDRVPLIDVPKSEQEQLVSSEERKTQPADKQDGDISKKSAPPPPRPKADVGKAAKSGQAAASKVGVVASFLGAVGSLLPGKLGHKLKEQSAVARDAQVSTLKTVQAPVRIQRKTDSLKRESGRLGVKTPKGAGLPIEKAEHINIEASTASQTEKTTPVQIEAQKVFSPRRVQTKEVYPGESILLSLRIDSKERRYPVGSFYYTVNSQQVPLDTLKETPAPVSKQGIVYFKPIETWRYWLPFLICGTIVIMTLLSIYYYLQVIGY